MIDLSRYIDLIVEPAFKDFETNSGSIRHAYVACLVAYHAVDRAAYPAKPRLLLEDWRKKSLEFKLVETVALTFKHVKSDDARRPLPPGTLRITHPLGLEGDGEDLELRNLYFVVRDAIKFLRKEATRIESSVPQLRR